MSFGRLLQRSAITAVKLPFAMAWDLISLGNMGETASTAKVLREHQQRKHLHDLLELVDAIKEARS